MKLGTETHNVETFGVNNQTAFTIEAHSISFKILSDQLYSDKILAPVRELSCNAYDAHVDAGKADVPFRVHMPNTLEPWFSVRDWGIGLSDDDVKHLYTTYFGSTKRDSNDKVGCLGLGSKSPFAYSDSFTVTSWFEGMKRTYTAFIGEEGIPMITQMGEEATDEVNGMEVSIAVKPNDFSDFTIKAKTALRRFNPAPEVVGCSDFELDSVEYWMEGDDWSLRKESTGYYNRHSTGPIAVQGSVAYPIDSSALKDLSSENRNLLGLSIDIHFDLGELAVTPSRESLSYSDGTKGTIDTIGNIIKRLDKVFAELPAKFEHEFDSCASHWDACILFNDLFAGGGSGGYAMNQLVRSTEFDLKWNDKKLKSHFQFESSDVSDSFRVVRFERRRQRAKNLAADYNGHWKFRAQTSSKFFLDDVGRGGNSRIKNMEFPVGVDTIYLVKTNDPNDFALFNQLMGSINADKVSTLPKPARETNSNGTSHSPQCKVWIWDGDGNDKTNWDQSNHKMRDGGVYVTLRRFKALNKHHTEFDLSHRHGVYRRAGLIDSSTPIYGLQPRNAKAIADNPKWVSLEDHVKVELEDVLKSSVLANKIANAEAFKGFDLVGQFSNNEHKMTDTDMWKDLDSSSVFKSFVATYKYMSNENTDGLSVITTAADLLNCSIPKGKPDYDLKALWNNVLATYPMFEFMAVTSGYYARNDISWSNSMFPKLVQYIKDIDKAL